MKLIVTLKEEIARDTMRVRLAPEDDVLLEEFQPGAHIEITAGGFTRRYSLTSSPHETRYYEICVLRTEPSRGGSAYIHKTLKTGDPVEVAGPFNAFPLKDNAQHSVFIAGGIGITPFLSMTEALNQVGKSFELHYSARSKERFLPLPGHIKSASFYVDENGRPGLDIETLLAGLPTGSDIYVCGPRPLIEAVRTKALELGWPSSSVHYESFGFTPRPDDGAIAIELAQSGMTIDVQPGTSILDALLENGVWANYACRRGECGSCVAHVLEGDVDHRDVCLSREQRASSLCPCVSWAKTDRLVIDL